MLTTIIPFMQVAIVLFCLCTGLAAMFRGWTPPWLRRRVLAPRIWGVGVLVLAAAIGVQRVAFPAWLVLMGAAVSLVAVSQSAWLLGRVERAR